LCSGAWLYLGAYARCAKVVLSWASRHSGIPAVLLAAVSLVLLFRIAKQSARFFAQVSVVLVLLMVLVRLGWLRF
jgi:hypothetical protein